MFRNGPYLHGRTRLPAGLIWLHQVEPAPSVSGTLTRALQTETDSLDWDLGRSKARPGGRARARAPAPQGRLRGSKKRTPRRRLAS